MRGEGGYDDGSEEAPRLTVLDLQVGREGGRAGGKEEEHQASMVYYIIGEGHIHIHPPSLSPSLAPPSFQLSGANAEVS